MPELKDKTRDGWEDAELDWDKYAYADKAQEAKRLITGAAAAAAREDEKETRRAERAAKKQQNSAWSYQVARKDEKDKRKEKKDRKKKWLKSQASTEAATKSDQGVKRGRTPPAENDGNDSDDWDELAKEERMAKKVRRGAVSQGAFDAQFADL